jgi:hypothetical protein
MVVDGVPDRAPWSQPDGSIAYMDLIDSIVTQLLFDLHDGRPENRPRPCLIIAPERSVRKIFGFKYCSK